MKGHIARTPGCQFSVHLEGLTFNGLRALRRALDTGTDLATSDLRDYVDALLRAAGIDVRDSVSGS
jgi:hypothetical protein